MTGVTGLRLSDVSASMGRIARNARPLYRVLQNGCGMKAGGGLQLVGGSFTEHCVWRYAGALSGGLGGCTTP